MANYLPIYNIFLCSERQSALKKAYALCDSSQQWRGRKRGGGRTVPGISLFGVTPEATRMPDAEQAYWTV